MAKAVVDFRMIGVGALLTLVMCGLTEARTPARGIVAGRGLDAQVAELETQVGIDPDNSVALHALVQAYLDRDAPGLAQAALDRAAPEIRHTPSIADLRVQTLTRLGRPQLAFATQRAVLAECSRGGCDPELEGRGQHRLRWLEQMVELGIGDPRLEPERALLAHRLASRQVRLEVH